MSKDLITLLQEKKSSFAAVMPKHMTAERLIKLALVAASRQPKLMQCTTTSVLQCLMTASQIGLEPGGPLAHCHLVPFKNGKTGKMEATFIVGWQGLIELARRSGKIKTVCAQVVHALDRFDYQQGTSPYINHSPAIVGNVGTMIAAYAVAMLEDGMTQFEVMTLDEVNAIRERSKAKDSGPWKTDFEQMARKTVVKRLCKYLPQSPEMSTAIEVDSRVDVEKPIDDIVDMGGILSLVEDSSDRKSASVIEPPQRKSAQKQEGNESLGATKIEPPNPKSVISSQKKKMLEGLIGKSALSREDVKEALGVKSMNDIKNYQMDAALKMLSENTQREPGSEG